MDIFTFIGIIILGCFAFMAWPIKLVEIIQEIDVTTMDGFPLHILMKIRTTKGRSENRFIKNRINTQVVGYFAEMLKAEAIASVYNETLSSGLKKFCVDLLEDVEILCVKEI